MEEYANGMQDCYCRTRTLFTRGPLRPFRACATRVLGTPVMETGYTTPSSALAYLSAFQESRTDIWTVYLPIVLRERSFRPDQAASPNASLWSSSILEPAYFTICN